MPIFARLVKISSNTGKFYHVVGSKGEKEAEESLI
jgi:hypothetical protein